MMRSTSQLKLFLTNAMTTRSSIPRLSNHIMATTSFQNYLGHLMSSNTPVAKKARMNRTQENHRLFVTLN